MPAYEIMHELIRAGIPCAVGMSNMGEVRITCLYSGKTYDSAESCLRHETPEGKPHEE